MIQMKMVYGDKTAPTMRHITVRRLMDQHEKSRISIPIEVYVTYSVCSLPRSQRNLWTIHLASVMI